MLYLEELGVFIIAEQFHYDLLISKVLILWEEPGKEIG